MRPDSFENFCYKHAIKYEKQYIINKQLLNKHITSNILFS